MDRNAELSFEPLKHPPSNHFRQFDYFQNTGVTVPYNSKNTVIMFFYLQNEQISRHQNENYEIPWNSPIPVQAATSPSRR